MNHFFVVFAALAMFVTFPFARSDLLHAKRVTTSAFGIMALKRLGEYDAYSKKNRCKIIHSFFLSVDYICLYSLDFKFPLSNDIMGLRPVQCTVQNPSSLPL